MAQAIRTLTVEQGIDPRDFALVAFGGAGPMHAAFLAQELEIGEVIVPRLAGRVLGLGDAARPRSASDFTRPFFRRSRARPTSTSSPRLRATALEGDGDGARGRRASRADAAASSTARRPALRRPGVHADDPDRPRRRAARAGLPRGDDRAASTTRTTSATATRTRARPVELVVAPRRPRSATSAAPSRRQLAAVAGGAAEPPRRDVVFERRRARDARSSRATSSASGTALDGPVIVEEATATTVVPPGCHARASTATARSSIAIGKEA